MKALRGFATAILSIFLFIAILAFSLTIIVKNVIQEQTLPAVIKQEIVPRIFESEDIKLTREQKDIIIEILDDKKADDIINLAINNFIEYKTNENYELSKKDISEIKKLISQHRDEIISMSKNQVTEEQINKYLTDENIKEASKVVFEKVEEELGEDEDITNIVTIYNYGTSANTKSILLGVIVLLIALIALVNWSAIKWMVPTGICLIVSSSFVCLIYSLIGFIKEQALDDIKIESLPISGIIMVGVTELLLGIALIILQHKFSTMEKIDG